MNLREKIKADLAAALQELSVDGYQLTVDRIEVFRPDNSKHGDYSTNVALKIGGKSDQSPMEIAKKTKVAQPTVRQTLDKLMRLKKIERVGQGRSTNYRKIWMKKTILLSFKKLSAGPQHERGKHPF